MSPASITVTVTTAGTPVPVTATPTRCARIRFESAGSGKTYVKTASGAIIATLQTAGNAWELWTGSDADLLNLTDYRIDAANSGDGVNVTYFAV